MYDIICIDYCSKPAGEDLIWSLGMMYLYLGTYNIELIFTCKQAISTSYFLQAGDLWGKQFSWAKTDVDVPSLGSSISSSPPKIEWSLTVKAQKLPEIAAGLIFE